MYPQITAVGDMYSFCCLENHRLITDSPVSALQNRFDGKTTYKRKDHHRRRQTRRGIKPL